MASAPKCKVCGSSHFGAAHVWKTLGAAIQDGDVVIRKIVAARTPVAQARADGLEAVVKKASSFDRVAYQREYMRKRRADDKTGKAKR